jgi:hypothetical protein
VTLFFLIDPWGKRLINAASCPRFAENYAVAEVRWIRDLPLLRKFHTDSVVLVVGSEALSQIYHVRSAHIFQVLLLLLRHQCPNRIQTADAGFQIQSCDMGSLSRLPSRP